VCPPFAKEGEERKRKEFIHGLGAAQLNWGKGEDGEQLSHDNSHAEREKRKSSRPGDSLPPLVRERKKKGEREREDARVVSYSPSGGRRKKERAASAWEL